MFDLFGLFLTESVESDELDTSMQQENFDITNEITKLGLTASEQDEFELSPQRRSADQMQVNEICQISQIYNVLGLA
jgi:hypothetical protein